MSSAALTNSLHILRDPESAAALLHPVRLRILRQLAEPGSAASVAREIGLPRQQVNYHLKELERAGAVAFVEERRKGNCNERVVRAVASGYLISPETLGDVGPDPATRRDRFSVAYLAATAARIIGELAQLSVRARKAGKRLASLTLETEIRFRSAEERARFAVEAAGMIATLAARYHDQQAPGGRPFRLVLASYPLITKVEPDGNEPATVT
jgi:DNA-binding transcriptional ArsR family regulator